MTISRLALEKDIYVCERGETMNTTAKAVSAPRLKILFLGLALFWSVLIVVLSGLNYWQSYSSMTMLVKSMATESYKKDLVYRRWATIHGGVYVPITPETPPNPYLSHIPERDINTPSGKKLTYYHKIQLDLAN